MFDVKSAFVSETKKCNLRDFFFVSKEHSNLA